MDTPTPTASANGKRKRLLTIVIGAFAVASIGYGAYWAAVARFHVTTDNAYVQGNVVQITPQIGGTVLAIGADDTDFVKAGQTLVKLDPADAQLALDQAEAQLGQTVREVRALYANNASYAANIALREADIVKARTEVDRATEDVARREGLVATGAVSNEELTHARNALAGAQSTLKAAEAGAAAAREQLTANRSLTEGTNVSSHPNVERAAARVREAYLALKRAELPAPVSGYVAKRSVQLGQRVAAGAPLMSIIALDQLWVDANFKEVQLRDMRVGQPAHLVADLYGTRVEYDGTVVGLGAGTGAAFALLPAQNATGNWIKVVQRVPVRIALDPKQMAEHPLRVGLSMEVDVDTRQKDGQSLTDGGASRVANATQTPVFDGFEHDAAALVNRIIASNLGRTVPAEQHAAHIAGASAALAVLTHGVR